MMTRRRATVAQVSFGRARSAYRRHSVHRAPADAGDTGQVAVPAAVRAGTARGSLHVGAAVRAVFAALVVGLLTLGGAFAAAPAGASPAPGASAAPGASHAAVVTTVAVPTTAPTATPAGTVHQAALAAAVCRWLPDDVCTCADAPPFFWFLFGAGRECRPGYSPRPLQPRITGNTDIGHSNESFTIVVTGTGFAPGEQVSLSMPGQGTLATATASATGGFTVPVRFPSGIFLGFHVLVARGSSSHSTARFTILVLPGPFNLSGFFGRPTGFFHRPDSRLVGLTYPSGRVRDVRVSSSGVVTVVSRTSATGPLPGDGLVPELVGGGALALAAVGLTVLFLRRRRAASASS